MKLNPLLCTDGYKLDHRSQYPEGTALVYTNMTARTAKYAPVLKHRFDDKIVFFGLQGVIKWFLIDCWNTNFFQRPKDEVVAEYQEFLDNFAGPGVISSEHIAELHDLGYLPIEIRAVAEGTRVPIGVPMFTIHNTHPKFFWLTNYLETVMSNETWKAITIATIAHEYRTLLDEYADKTGGDKGFVPFQAHDFSMRGMSGVHDSSSANSGHLVAFTGSDVLPANYYVRQYYGADFKNEFISGGVPASEHSVMTMEGPEGEYDLIKRLITEVYPTGIVSLVSDGYDFWKVITEYLPALKSEIMARDGKMVIRPDSGDPVKILTGYNAVEHTRPSHFGDDIDIYGQSGYEVVKYLGKWYDIKQDWSGYYYQQSNLTDAEIKGLIPCLWDIFGGTITDTGYKLLDSHIGTIYGDSITLDRCEQILRRLEASGFASTNVVFGIGSYTYQHITRDSFGMAMKATYGVVNGVGREIFKDPKTGDGMKKSAKGLLSVVEKGGTLVLKQQVSWEEARDESLLEIVFKDGVLVKDQTLSEIRQRLQGEGA